MNAAEMVKACQQHQQGETPPEVYQANTGQRAEEVWPGLGAPNLPPEREDRETVPQGQSPYEIADRQREQGTTVTHEEASGWA